ncbi:CHAD domain-containing protein [Jidongwangia harbinensis]|uniref:CHAD domain-containing protein n=1 Tax=Jidongwangia harbinensis TaxID=2878561 RepID=UPI001CDA4076|nr:CHAD domain-containing protein [Jidongwangia harbinensis]MCA2211602.1 CHAD domain-containing protein [Jidongwangia harbinensis]
MAVRIARPPGGAALDLDALRVLLTPAFEVSAGRQSVVRRTVLDTFDRRLARAGQRLVLVAGAGDERLELTRNGRTVAQALDGTALRVPAMAGALPDGTLKDRVAPRAGIRALLAVGEHRRRTCRVELRHANGETVVRLDVDEPAEDGAAPPPTVAVWPVPGHRREADHAWRLVTTMLEPVPCEPAAPPAARVRPIDPGVPAQTLLAAELTRFLGQLRDNLPGAVADIDTEFLHHVRVAVRRTRSSLKLGRPALPPHVRDVWEPQFKWLGDRTTPVRDLDVYQLGLPEMAGWLDAAAAADLEPFRVHLAHRRAAERRALVGALRGARLRQLLDDWPGALAELADSAHGPDGAAWSAGALARANLARAHRRVVRDGTAISDASPPEDLHDLRKRCKELRYALDMFAPVLGDAAVRTAIKDLKKLQNVLGRFQDSEVQITTLRGFAHEMVAGRAPADTLLAMGELTGRLHAEQQRARAEFAGAFAAYVRPAGRRRMARLLADLPAVC